MVGCTSTIHYHCHKLLVIVSSERSEATVEYYTHSSLTHLTQTQSNPLRRPPSTLHPHPPSFIRPPRLQPLPHFYHPHRHHQGQPTRLQTTSVAHSNPVLTGTIILLGLNCSTTKVLPLRTLLARSAISLYLSVGTLCRDPSVYPCHSILSMIKPQPVLGELEANLGGHLTIREHSHRATATPYIARCFLNLASFPFHRRRGCAWSRSDHCEATSQ